MSFEGMQIQGAVKIIEKLTVSMMCLDHSKMYLKI